MPEGWCFSLELRLCPELLLGDELPPSLYPVPYLLGLLSNASSALSIFRYRAKAGCLVFEERRRKWSAISSSFLLIVRYLLLLFQSIAHYCYQCCFLRRAAPRHSYKEEGLSP
jgi:hypothetical protein